MNLFNKIRDFIFNCHKFNQKKMQVTKNPSELAKDLLAKQPYGVKVEYKGNVYSVNQLSSSYVEIENDSSLDFVSISEVKPFLRKISSLTEEDKNKFIKENFIDGIIDEDGDIVEESMSYLTSITDCINYLDFLNSKLIDYRNLIDNNQAIEITEDNNPYK